MVHIHLGIYISFLFCTSKNIRMYNLSLNINRIKEQLYLLWE